ncbi:FeoA family protein [Tepidibacter sp.]|uniref:FeoA family protein n=1 Tax=Tepidibacter sp. TaxID=2529387 RepID=UPI002ED61A2E
MAGTLVSGMMNEAYRFERTSDYSMKNLSKAEVDVEYIVKEIKTDDEEMKSFLFTLGCYEGEKVTVISVLAENYVISVKDARYSIDVELAEAIII